TVHTTEFDELEVDGLEVVPSFASGLRSTKVHASVLERDLAAIAADLPPEQPAHLHPLAASLAGRGLQAQHARRSADFTEWDGNLAGEDIPDTVARPQSPTGLQNWASCGYRYFLGHVLRLSDRDDPERVLDLN